MYITAVGDINQPNSRCCSDKPGQIGIYIRRILDVDQTNLGYKSDQVGIYIRPVRDISQSNYGYDSS